MRATIANMYGSCKHPTIRELAPTVLWCPHCGAHRRQEDGRWLRWSPAGVKRIRPIAKRDDRQMPLGFARDCACSFHKGELTLCPEHANPPPPQRLTVQVSRPMTVESVHVMTPPHSAPLQIEFSANGVVLQPSSATDFRAISASETHTDNVFPIDSRRR